MPNPTYSRRLRRWRTACIASLLAAAGALADEPPQPLPGGSGVNPALVQTLAPLLADWIARSRDAAITEGVREIPSAVRAVLAGYVPEATLERVRWRTGGGGGMSLQQNVFAFGDVPAITLDYVIVFADEKAALEDPKLWAHELKHVMQFEQWGLAQFAVRYLTNDGAVEQEAADYRWEFMKLRGLTPPPAPPR
jgi:hypothetical protein